MSDLTNTPTDLKDSLQKASSLAQEGGRYDEENQLANAV